MARYVIFVAAIALMFATVPSCKRPAGSAPAVPSGTPAATRPAAGQASTALPGAIRAEDPAFAEVVAADAAVREVAAGYQFTEGPAWFGGRLVFSDIATNTMHQWSPDKGVSVFRRPSHDANGNIVDAQGRLVTCEQGSRSITRTDSDGKVVTLASSCGGRKLNSPNDAAVKSDGTIWFTDPSYGIKPQQKELAGCWVFRIDPGATQPVPVIRDIPWPNGICFSPDEKFLYVGNSDVKDACVRRFPVLAGNTVGEGAVFARISPGFPDGMRTDWAGRLYVTTGDGVQVFSPDGKLLGRILTPDAATNCCFVGQTLYITARPRVWMVELKARDR